MDLKKQFGQRLREIRRARQLSMESLGELAGVNPKYLGQIERGVQAASVDMIERLAKGLKVEPHELFAFRRTDRQLRSQAQRLLAETDGENLSRIVTALQALLH